MKIPQICICSVLRCQAARSDYRLSCPIPNRNFGGIRGDVVGATNVIARIGALLLVAVAM
jgi:cobalamin synthase